MIGFLPQTVRRRPIYSLTGQKLCYLVSGPEGEWIVTLGGRKYARLTKVHKEWLKGLAATTNACGGTMVMPQELFEQ